jgi:[ribosomal protein S18]-alanine N-acetyltransferase
MLAERGSGGGFQVRACTRDDLSAIREILEQAPEAANWSAAALENALDVYPGHFLVSESNTAVIGFVLARQIADEAEILNLAVSPACRRHGIGKALMQHLLATFQDPKLRKLFLEVRESNAPAIAFYRSLGFAQSGRRAGYYHHPLEAALVFELNLPDRPQIEPGNMGLS